MNVFTRWLIKVLLGVSIIELRKGDVVVIRTSKELSEADLESIAEALKPAFPDNQCIALSSGTVLEIVRKADKEKSYEQ